MVGDSLTVGALGFGNFLRRSAAAGLTATVDAKVGRFTPTGAQIVAGRAASGRLEPTVVVALGTNDMSGLVTDSRLDALIDQVLRATGPDRRVIWVNLRLRATARAQRFNDALVRMARRHPNLQIADWAVHPGSALLAGDGVHLTTEGYRQRAQFMVDELREVPCSEP